MPGQLPNLISSLRLCLAAAIAAVLLMPAVPRYRLALALFLVAILTDIADGLAARWLKAETAFGSHLDPLADKALVLATLVAMLAVCDAPILLMIAVMSVAAFEVHVGLVRLSLLSQRVPLHASREGKLKAALQYAACLAWLFYGASGLRFKWLWIAAFLPLTAAVLLQARTLTDYRPAWLARLLKRKSKARQRRG